jgi:hypothetical protein
MKKKIEKYTTSKWSLKKPLYLDKKDKRYKEHLAALKKNGFSHAETWSLDSVISEFVLPRLKCFKQVNNGVPCGFTEEKWNEIIDKMIFAFEWNLAYENDENLDLDKKLQKANWKKYNEGMKLFSKHFRNLWW